MDPLPPLPPPGEPMEEKTKKKKKKKKKMKDDDEHLPTQTEMKEKKKKKKKSKEAEGSESTSKDVPLVEATPVEASPKPKSKKPKSKKPKSKRIKVMAPATLPEGASFLAEVNGSQFTATVPRGGVQKGQIFKVPEPSMDAPLAPVGRWRTELMDCSDCCSPLCCMAFNFPCIVSAQMIERLNLSLGGCRKDGGANGEATRFGACVLYPSVLGLLTLIVVIFAIATAASGNVGLAYFTIVLYIVLPAWLIFVTVGMICARKSMRELYNIPGSCCGDFCTLYWCSCCAVMQMANFDTIWFYNPFPFHYTIHTEFNTI